MVVLMASAIVFARIVELAGADEVICRFRIVAYSSCVLVPQDDPEGNWTLPFAPTVLAEHSGVCRSVLKAVTNEFT